MKFLSKLPEILKRFYAWVAKESPHQADPRICPLCFDSITEETKFIKYCPVCRNWEVVKGKATRSLYARCRKVGCKANGTLAQRPFLPMKIPAVEPSHSQPQRRRKEPCSAAG